MKTRTIIEDITRDDLVDLLCTATYGSYWLGMQYDKTKGEGETYEDVAADILLKGGTVEMIDYYADDSDEVYTDKGYWDTDAAIYPITLEDIKRELEAVADGTIKNDAEEKGFALRALQAFQSDRGDFDNVYAEALMQCIMFNELIYG